MCIKGDYSVVEKSWATGDRGWPVGRRTPSPVPLFWPSEGVSGAEQVRQVPPGPSVWQLISQPRVAVITQEPYQFQASLEFSQQRKDGHEIFIQKENISSPARIIWHVSQLLRMVDGLFLLTCDRECKEICKVASVAADPLHSSSPYGAGAGQGGCTIQNHGAGRSCLLRKGFKL